MIVYYCKNCNRAVAGNNLSKCKQCGRPYVSLGVDSSKWSSLSSDQKRSLINKYTNSGNGSTTSNSKSATSNVAVSDVWVWILSLVPAITYFVLPQFFRFGYGGVPK